MRPLDHVFIARNWPGRQQGAVAILLTVAMVALLAMAGLTLDGGHLLLNKTRLQNAVDAAALSGAKTLSQLMGATGAASTVQAAALNTLQLNAVAAGNEELAKAIKAAGGVGGFATVELAPSVYGPFGFPGPANAKYVKVTVPEYGLVGFFWRFLQELPRFVGNSSKPNDLKKQVAAVAVAGPSPTEPCDISPIMVCGDPSKYDPANGVFWGYHFGDLQVLKSASGSTSVIGPGNFQLIRIGENDGAKDIRDALCKGIRKCNVVGKTVETEPGNTVGPVAQGLNTRFGVYNGPVSSSSCPPDLVTNFSTPKMTYDSTSVPPQVKYQGQQVFSKDGNLTTSSSSLFDYNDWFSRSSECKLGSGVGCQSNGVYERRMLKIVVGNCDGKSGGRVDVPVLGFACFFVLQTIEQNGTEAQVFGQFVNECAGDGYPGATPVDDAGPQIIQLYKTFTNDSGTPGSDS